MVLGDDLSGTAEALAAALAGAGSGWVLLHPADIRPRPRAGDRGVRWDGADLDVRRLPHDMARDRYAAALGALGRERRDVVLLKIDSLLRGNVAAALASVPPAADRPVVLAPALPAQGRRTLQGRVLLDDDGRPRPGALEGAGVDVAAAAGVPTALLGLDVVRARRRRLSTALGTLAAEGVVAVCDAETEEDLDAVAAAAAGHRHPVVVGASGVAAALGRALRADAGSADGSRCSLDRGCAAGDTPGPVLVVVGTAEQVSRPQVARLEQAGAVVRTLDPSHPDGATGTAESLRRALHTGCAVLQLPPRPLDPDRSELLLGLLAHATVAVAEEDTDIRLVLTGGATARAVLTRLGVKALRLRCQVHAGAAHLCTEDDRQVVTRPGSHGGRDSLVQLARHLGAHFDSRAHDPAHEPAQRSTEGQP